MQLPKIDLSSLPDLSTLTGVFGSIRSMPGSDDTIVILMTYVFEVLPPGGG
jgi:hypothetical protein